MDLTDCCIGQVRCPCGRPPTANLIADEPEMVTIDFGSGLKVRVSRRQVRNIVTDLLAVQPMTGPICTGSRLPTSAFTDRC